ncbi:MAG: hypothetical protein PHN18_01570 [Sulfurospirillaceae bacterium]|nr:hypothetical protein [Sulfurospirillaceae bacterium]MDD2827859.1 hypothetical protein [Sulfurospirillaceae bacterium]
MAFLGFNRLFLFTFCLSPIVGFGGPLMGEFISRTTFDNPYANIPAQCYIETIGGTQNACLFCHTNAPARMRLGNNNPQAGLSSVTGNLQTTYAFTPATLHSKMATINPWENTLYPEKLEYAYQKSAHHFDENTMLSYLTEDNWAKAYAKRKGKMGWENGIDESPWRLFPDLNPVDLPASSDGFVRTNDKKSAIFGDMTGWRAINFMPYGIFTPMNGSVSGIYIRLPHAFMKDEQGHWSEQLYAQNLDLLERAMTDRLTPNDPTHYYGEAKKVEVIRGLYPLYTEFAHPLHYVDLRAKGTRAKRVKEMRYMVKTRMFYPGEAADKEEDAPIYLNEKQGWINNGAGWILAGFIEDATGDLRPQKSEELMQCIGCHSDHYGFEPASFTSGTGNTIDSTWAFPRKFPATLGWKEMDYLGFRTDHGKALTSMGDPLNRATGKGEFGYFLKHVVGANLYGMMPQSMETFLMQHITKANGYSEDWEKRDTTHLETMVEQERLHAKLMQEFVAKKAYLSQEGFIAPELFYPTPKEALHGAINYRKVVATQRYTLGKDVFDATPFTFRYYRNAENGYTHMDGSAYHLGDIITDRPIEKEATIMEGVGNALTLIHEQDASYDGEYVPLLKFPLHVVKKP